MSKVYLNRSGILLVDKPAGMSSADAINKIKRKHPFKRIGHGGTLDPFATGLLVVLVGEGTKIARFLLDGEKEYIALAHLGKTTDTGDHTGTVVEESAIPNLNLAEWQKIAGSFLGNSEQIPPKYSALKVKGKALYEYARAGEEIEIKSRNITITDINIQDVSTEKLRFQVSCSGGTYIRVLANDIAKKAGTLAYLEELRRTRSSSFKIADAITLTDLLEKNSEELLIRSLEEALEHLPQLTCNSEQTKKIRQGNISVFQEMRDRIKKPGYFLLLTQESGKNIPLAIANHNPMMIPFCSLERVFDPLLIGT